MFFSKRDPRRFFFGLGLAGVIAVSGCAPTGPSQDYERLTRQQYETIEALKREVERLNQEVAVARPADNSLASGKTELERNLSSQMAAGDLSVSMQARGLVVTVLDRILFDSGKAGVKTTARSTLSSVADTLRGPLEGHMIYVEGHTDNVPIRYSPWRSNWELSTARATEVIHYFIEACGIDPRRLAASGYGEFQPVTENSTEAGRMKNRRVEIVITPRKILPDARGAGA